jgi:hypothetical protein
MAYEMKQNTGSLFKNDKGGNPNRPDYTGNCLVNGKVMRISAWINTIKTGEKAGGKYMQLNFQEPQEAKAKAPAPAAAPELPSDNNDDVPF